MHKYRYFIFVVAILLTALICWDIYSWIIISVDKSRSFEEVKQIYLRRFPMALRKPVLLTLIDIGLLLFAMCCFLKTKKIKYLRIGSWALFGFDALIVLWLLFSLS